MAFVDQLNAAKATVSKVDRRSVRGGNFRRWGRLRLRPGGAPAGLERRERAGESAREAREDVAGACGCERGISSAVHDDAAVLEALYRGLVAMRVKPYYLHHADLARGTAHFRTGIAAGQLLVRSLRGSISGLCQPT